MKCEEVTHLFLLKCFTVYEKVQAQTILHTNSSSHFDSHTSPRHALVPHFILWTPHRAGGRLLKRSVRCRYQGVRAATFRHPTWCG